ncbi:hypothetical protein FHS56_000353 [Thermonema lapsum]|uniref:Uncharacterized protein n=1 Tax=Thermonema lapsum TaxID=28195 RepID=A0A846MND1_9BACT|nr:hypothetical protein [Thermonema lapsum]
MKVRLLKVMILNIKKQLYFHIFVQSIKFIGIYAFPVFPFLL